MAVTSTILDGNNVALSFAGSTSADLFTLNVATGAVSSPYLPAEWCEILSANARTLFGVTTLAQRQTFQFLDRLIAIGSLDGATITTSASLGVGLATLVATVDGDTTLLVQLPHSIFGAASLGQSVPASGGGGGGGSVVPGDLGLVRWTGSVTGILAGQVAGFNGTTLLPAINTEGPALGIFALTSTSANAIRTSGEASAVLATSGIVAEDSLFLGIGGAVTKVPPTASGSWSQKLGRALGPSVETSPGSSVYVVPMFVQMSDAVYYP